MDNLTIFQEHYRKRCIKVKNFHVDRILLFLYYLSLEIICTNLNPFPPRMLRAKFVKNWPSGSGEDF